MFRRLLLFPKKKKLSSRFEDACCLSYLSVTIVPCSFSRISYYSTPTALVCKHRGSLCLVSGPKKKGQPAYSGGLVLEPKRYIAVAKAIQSGPCVGVVGVGASVLCVL